MAVTTYRELQPGRRFLVRFAGDPGVIHERVALWPVASAKVGGAASSFAILTADGDAYEEALEDYCGFRLMDIADPKYPGDFVKDFDIGHFSEPHTEDALLKEIVVARGSIVATI